MSIEQLPGHFILTADIGGSHITTGLYNPKTGFVVPESIIRAEVNSKGAADEILSAWVGALQSVLAKADAPVNALALAMPGPFGYGDGISYIKGLSKYESIYGMNIRKHLARKLDLDGRQIMFRNDAESTIAGEVLAGAGKDYNRVIGITLGTGFGSAFSNSKQTVDLNLGSDAYKETIADDYFSTRWFVKRYQQVKGKSLDGGVKQLAECAENDAQCREIFEEFANSLASFLLKPVADTQAEVLVICGNIARASKFFLPQLKRQLAHIAIELAQLGENAALIGAAAVFERKADHSNLS